jgi:ferredoxin
MCGCSEKSSYSRFCRRCYIWDYKRRHPEYVVNITAHTRLYYRRNRESEKRRTIMFKASKPERMRCYNIIHANLHNGTLFRPDYCTNCGKHCRPDSHHYDYSRPYDITWLCRSCHLLLSKDDYSKAIFDRRYIDYMSTL